MHSTLQGAIAWWNADEQHLALGSTTPSQSDESPYVLVGANHASTSAQLCLTFHGGDHTNGSMWH